MQKFHLWVLVTGANSGIGEATVLNLASRGFNVLAGIRKEENLKHFDNSMYVQKIVPWKLDVNNLKDIEELKNFQGYENIVGIVHNAGIFDLGPVLDKTQDRILKIFETNVFSIINLSKLLLPVLTKNKGRIILLGSDGGLTNFTGNTLYCMSKHAIEALAEGLHDELISKGIRVVNVIPGNIATSIFEKAIVERENEQSSTHEELAQFRANNEQFLASPSPSVVALSIHQALTHPNPPLRLPVMQENEIRNVIAENLEKILLLNKYNEKRLKQDEISQMVEFAALL